MDLSLIVSSDTDILTVLAGLPQGETTFEYLTGCWKRLNSVNREASKLVSYLYLPPSQYTDLQKNLETSDKLSWHAAADKIKGLIIAYIGMTLEDPSMFPQPDK